MDMCKIQDDDRLDSAVAVMHAVKFQNELAHSTCSIHTYIGILL